MAASEDSKSKQYYFTAAPKKGYFSCSVRLAKPPAEAELTPRVVAYGEIVDDVVFYYSHTERSGCVPLGGKDGLYALLHQDYPGNAGTLYSTIVSLSDNPSQ